MNLLTRFFTGKLRSRVYAWIYLACIPVFACLYALRAGDFQHTTVRYERSLAADLDTIRGQLTEALNRHIGKQYGKSAIIDHGWALRGNAVSLGGGKYEGDRFQFNLVLDLEKNAGAGPERMRGNLITMSFGPEYQPMVNDAGEIKWVMKTVRFDGDMVVEFDPYALLINPPTEFQGKKTHIPFLPITADLNDRLNAYADAMDGFPSRASGTFFRMLYLSVVTITTLGFGDIVPVSGWARSLVGLEALLGVILIGYYLSSLSNATQVGRDLGPDQGPTRSSTQA
jgi:hypothetical protein